MLGTTTNTDLFTNDKRITSKAITLRIDKGYYQEPVISRLISDYDLTVNITGAILGESAADDGWFGLELRGQHNQILQGLHYLQSLGLEIWDKSNANTEEGW